MAFGWVGGAATSAATWWVKAQAGPLFKFIKLAPLTFIIPTILFLILSLAGCLSSAPTIPSLYVVALTSSSNGTLADMQVRLGYFGMCGDDGDTRTCLSAAGHFDPDEPKDIITLTGLLFPEVVNNSNFQGALPELQNMVLTGLDLQDQIFGKVLLTGSALFAIGLLFMFPYKLVKKSLAKLPPDTPLTMKQQFIRRGCYSTIWLGVWITFAACIGTTETAGALGHATANIKGSSILMKEGVTIQVLQWMAFGFMFLFVLCMPLLLFVRRENMLDQFMDHPGNLKEKAFEFAKGYAAGGDKVKKPKLAKFFGRGKASDDVV
ncbi:Ca2+ regulator and membrane fusion protein Fig1-domain-containing protein [Sordaria brevicollis]|uniref:Ca2+ regulator and membrane fusion protein Fig1-domain-containing protein n=1 Tax=Sordaria brevicollis TaxID=83679 RepID=A0AAE0PM89_SORBR|nr:Ca2+ regulator and membrane fusion protein Fig1-domain-containing protein [Sordaria brevicollis]